IAVANYNSFTDSPAVGMGWVIVRDIANMFFVVIFLVIAFGTILGVEQYHYKKTLPRLLLMAILINFSKTIAGLVIDFGQVIMLTFVNAFTQAAGGNFLEILRIRELWSVAPTPGRLLEVPDIAGGLVLACLVSIVSLVVMTIMTMILVFRMVMLWLLVVISPLAFFSAAVPSKAISGYYERWWKEFTNYVIVGPVLAFFIWLSLAVVSAPSGQNLDSVGEGITLDPRVKKEDTTITATAAGIGTESSMIKYLIGLSMLVGGLMMTQQLGVAGSGMAGGALNWAKKEGTGALKETSAWAKGQALRPVKAAFGVAREQTDKWGGKVYGGLAKSGIPLVSGFGAKRAGKIRTRRRELEQKAGAFVAGMSLDEAIGYKKSIKVMPIKSDEMKAKMALADKKIIGGLRFKSEKEYDKQGNLVRDNKSIAQEALKGLGKRAEETSDDKYYTDIINPFKQARPDMLEEKEMVDVVKPMSGLQVASKVQDRAFDPETDGGKQLLGYFHKNKDIWTSIYKNSGKGKKDFMDAYSSGLSENRETDPNLEKDIGKRKTLIQGFSNEQLKKIEPSAVTKENVAMMSSNQQEVMFKANKISVDSIDADRLEADDGALAGQIAQHGSVELKSQVQEKHGKKYLAGLEASRKANPGLDPEGKRYNDTKMATSKGMLRSGGGINASFNVNTKGNFKKDEDKMSYVEALRSDPSIALNLKPEEIKGTLAVTTRDALSNSSAIRKLLGAAKTDEQKDVLEKIIQEVYQATGRKADKESDEMMSFMEGSGRIREHIPKEMMERVKKQSKKVFEESIEEIVEKHATTEEEKEESEGWKT
ncbi:MAG: hypothetical protein U9P90_02720, partial [Patescibacteria group bacterium]|nr:hypothetical protein [Patescibacteria group bacterium]